MRRLFWSVATLIFILLLHVCMFIYLSSVDLPKPKIVEPKKSKKIRVSLLENLEASKEALVKNSIEPTQKKSPPIPKGSQLKTPKPIQQEIQKEVQKPTTIQKPTHSKPSIDRVAHKEPKVAKKETLFDKLSKKIAPDQDQESKVYRHSKISQNIKDAYGEKFALLSLGEQKYILDNQEIMRRITQSTLERVGSVNIPNNLRINSSNLIEFYLMPNGDITEIKTIQKSGFFILDDTTIETIKYAYSKYPRPQQKTLIRYRFNYYLRGY